MEVPATPDSEINQPDQIDGAAPRYNPNDTNIPVALPHTTVRIKLGCETFYPAMGRRVRQFKAWGRHTRLHALHIAASSEYPKRLRRGHP
jgi:hypothetical protein